MHKAEVLFRLLGFAKKYKNDLIIYKNVKCFDDEEVDEITFCRRTHRIVLYHGSNFGPDAYIMTPALAKAIAFQIKELDWEWGDKK